MNTLAIRLGMALLVSLAIGFALLVFWNHWAFREQGPERFHQSAMRFIADEAEQIWTDQGQPGIHRFFILLDHYFPGEFGWYDSGGHDLLGGPDRPELAQPIAPSADSPLERVTIDEPLKADRKADSKKSPHNHDRRHFRSRRGPFREPTPPVRVSDGKMAFLIPSESGKYRLVQFVPAPPPLHVPFGPALALGCVLALFGIVMSWHVARPIRALKLSVERFGQGDLAQRSSIDRRDEIGDLSRTFNRMADQISGIVERERGLVRSVAHEVRGPLTRMKLLLERLRENRDTTGTLNRLDSEIAALGHIPDTLLNLARIETGNFESNPEKTDFALFLQDLLDRFDPVTAKLGIPIESRLEGIEDRQFRIDTAVLERAIENVIDNALRHSPPGTNVVLDAQIASGTIELTVRDFGPGVPDEDREAIFRPFFRSDRSRNRGTGGVGLGLAIAKASVIALGGTIDATNAVPGLCVTIRIPVNETTDE